MANNLLVRKRFKNLFFVCLILTISLVIYYFVYTAYPSLRIKCLFFEITGLKCPGCGVTRLLVNFVWFNFKEGIKYNYFVGFTMPFFLFLLGYCSWAYIYNRKYSKWFNVLLSIYIVLLLVFFIVRNIVGI